MTLIFELKCGPLSKVVQKNLAAGAVRQVWYAIRGRPSSGGFFI